MAYDETFWAAISTAAPVIALAAIVALLDGTLIGRAQTVLNMIQDRPSSAQDDPWGHDFFVSRARDIRKWAGFAWLVSLVTLIIQAALLVVSLCALALKQDIMPFWLAISMATGGVALLALSTLVLMEQRWALERGLFRPGGVFDSYLAGHDSADRGEADPDEPGTHLAAAPRVGIADELTKLSRLRDSGVITDDEFANQKARLLG